VNPPVRAVIVTFSPGPFLAECVRTLGAASAAPVLVTVVDNGSTDGTRDWVRAQPDLELVESDENVGYGRAANLGIGETSEPWVLVVNPDISFEPGAVDQLLAAAERWPHAGAVGPRILTQEGAVYPSARELPSFGRGIGHAAVGWFWPSNPWTAAYRREREAPTERTTGWLSGACLLLRREAVTAVGGFDPKYFMYFEDIDLCERIGAAGWDVVYAPTATVRHHGAHATAVHAVRMRKAHHESAYRYLAGRYPGRAWAPLRAALRAGLWARFQVSRAVPRAGGGAAVASPRRPPNA
jgi:N-acetylglucosaminyl-diphospho-decaprenol L-rhamnosyltransferase